MTTHPTSHPTNHPTSEQATDRTTGPPPPTESAGAAGTTGRHRLTAEPSSPPRPTTTPATRDAETQPEVRRGPVHYDDRGRIASYRRTARRRPATQAGGIITLLVGLAVLNAQWALYPTTYQGQSDANWALLFMMVSTGAALRILVGNPGRHLFSVAAIMACGLGFVLRGLLIAGGEPAAVDAFEVVCGALLLLGGGLAAAWPALTPDPPAPVSPS